MNIKENVIKSFSLSFSNLIIQCIRKNMQEQWKIWTCQKNDLKIIVILIACLKRIVVNF